MRNLECSLDMVMVGKCENGKVGTVASGEVGQMLNIADAEAWR